MTQRNRHAPSPDCVCLARDAKGVWIIHGLEFEKSSQSRSLQEALRIAQKSYPTANSAILVINSEIESEPIRRNPQSAARAVLLRLQGVLDEVLSGTVEPTYFRSHGLEVDLVKSSATVDGLAVPLTQKEKTIFSILARRVGEVVRYDVLTEAVWGAAHRENRQYLRVLMGTLRAKLEGGKRKGRILMTERGVGYYLIREEELHR
jgi:DNA-binding winged helix-turn-helix (wHTH) protein